MEQVKAFRELSEPVIRSRGFVLDGYTSRSLAGGRHDRLCAHANTP